MGSKQHDEDTTREIRNDVDCRAARPKFQNGVWTPAKISDVTGGGLYLLVKPGLEQTQVRPSRSSGRWPTVSMAAKKPIPSGRYGKGDDGTFSLAQARRKRDDAKELLKNGMDPSLEKQLAKHREAAARPFGEWVDEWLAAKKTEKDQTRQACHGAQSHDHRSARIVGRLFEGCVSASLTGRTSSVPTCSPILRSMKPWKPATVRSIGEARLHLCRPRRRQLQSVPRLQEATHGQRLDTAPGVTEAEDVARIFKLINAHTGESDIRRRRWRCPSARCADHPPPRHDP